MWKAISPVISRLARLISFQITDSSACPSSLDSFIHRQINRTTPILLPLILLFVTVGQSHPVYSQNRCLALYQIPFPYAANINPDSVMIDTCGVKVDTLSFGVRDSRLYGRHDYYVVFNYHTILPIPVAPIDSVLFVDRSEINGSFSNVRAGFDTLYTHFGGFKLRKPFPQISDTSDPDASTFCLWFDNYVKIDSVEAIMRLIPMCHSAVFASKPYASTVNQWEESINYYHLPFPNPSASTIGFFAVREHPMSEERVRVFDIQGHLVTSLLAVPGAAHSNYFSINVRNLLTGVYWARFDDFNFQFVKK